MTSAPRSAPDAVTLLTLYVLLLVAVPSRLTVAPLGAAGSPALLVGLAALAWWTYDLVQRVPAGPRSITPVATTFALFAGAVLAAYVMAMSRPIDANESSMADLGLVAVASWGGVLLLAGDGTDSLRRLETLLRRLVVAGGAIATLAVVQFATGTSYVDRLSVPGLRANIEIGGVAVRNGFNRPSGTALHPIELGSVIAMILPIALTLALVDRDRSPVRRWFPVVAIGFATALSISRSALIATGVALVLVAVGWSRGRRLGAAFAVTVLGGSLFMTVPGLLGSLLGLFTGIGEDDSAESRSGSYGIAGEFIAHSPVLGRGLFTFLPRYRILDNQYLALLIEIGVVGLVLFLALLVAGLWCARRVAFTATDDRTRQIGRALLASIAAGAVGLALFDGFSFPMSTGLLFLVIGLSGAARRLTAAGTSPSSPARPGVGSDAAAT